MKKILIIICLLFLTGCHDYRETDSLAIVDTLAIDYQNEMYEITMEVKETNHESLDTAYLIDCRGQSIDEAFDNLYNSFDKELYFTQLDILILTPEALTETNNIIDYIIDNHHFAFNFKIALSEHPADAINLIKSEDEIFGVYFKKILNNKSEFSITYPLFLDKFLNQEKITLPLVFINDGDLDLIPYEVAYE